jgi:hypothetical protein
MERMQSLFEHEVKYNLTESGVWPLRIGELLDSKETVTDFLEQQASYPESPGLPRLREHISSWYLGAEVDNVTVMAGGAESNYATLWSLLEEGDRAAIMLPNYMQTWGIAQAYATADRFHLAPMADGGERRWGLEVDELSDAVTKRTKLILVTNPNNPTGAVLTEDEMSAVVDEASRVGAWIVADEIYRGAEISSDETTASFWGRYEKVIITSGVSKAFGLPGLRIGWVVAPRRLIKELWRHHDYLSLMPSIASQLLAEIALAPSRREAILTRTRSILRANLPQLEQWIDTRADIFDYVRPRAGAILYLRAQRRLNTKRLAEQIRREQSVLLVPGEQLGVRSGFRLGFGHDIAHTLEGLARVDRVLASL